MTDAIQIKVTNLGSELDSFPIDQAITLVFSEPVEDSFLKDYIHLVQALDSGSIFHIGDLYNQNVGLVKENFKNVDITVKVISNDPFTVQVKPVKPLTPGHTYQLLVQDRLPTEYINVTKTVSYFDSNIEIGSSPSDYEGVLSIEVVEDSVIEAAKHLVKIKINGEIFTLDLVKSPSVSYKGFILKLKGTAFLKGEMFEIVSKKATSKLNATFLQRIIASASKTVKPLEKSENKLSFEDLIKYNEEPPKEEVSLDFHIEYSRKNTFKIIFKDDVVELLDLEEMSHTFEEAFNMYTLGDLDLFNEALLLDVSYRVLNSKEIEIKVGVVDED